jgi:acetyl esterase/lipase
MLRSLLLLVVTSVLSASVSAAQLSPGALWAVEAETQYQMSVNVPYPSADGAELMMDIYSRRDVTTPQPTLVYFHGGFWVAGAKENQLLAFLPWLGMGWNVVNVGYRLGGVAPAPAALVDSFCALRFIASQADRFNIDTERLVVTGQSAGGHLALAQAMIPESAGFADGCPAGDTPKVAAVINWYGATDVQDVIEGPNRSDLAAQWFEGVPNAMALAQRVSPLTYVTNGLPPILTVHGDADTIVPYAHAVELHEALEGTDTAHRLVTVPRGGHGRFTAEERESIYTSIQQFLREANVLPR